MGLLVDFKIGPMQICLYSYFRPRLRSNGKINIYSTSNMNHSRTEVISILKVANKGPIYDGLNFYFTDLITKGQNFKRPKSS